MSDLFSTGISIVQSLIKEVGDVLTHKSPENKMRDDLKQMLKQAGGGEMNPATEQLIDETKDEGMQTLVNTLIEQGAISPDTAAALATKDGVSPDSVSSQFFPEPGQSPATS